MKNPPPVACQATTAVALNIMIGSAEHPRVGALAGQNHLMEPRLLAGTVPMLRQSRSSRDFRAFNNRSKLLWVYEMMMSVFLRKSYYAAHVALRLRPFLGCFGKEMFNS